MTRGRQTSSPCSDFCHDARSPILALLYLQHLPSFLLAERCTAQREISGGLFSPTHCQMGTLMEVKCARGNSGPSWIEWTCKSNSGAPCFQRLDRLEQNQKKGSKIWSQFKLRTKIVCSFLLFICDVTSGHLCDGLKHFAHSSPVQVYHFWGIEADLSADSL